MVCDIWTVNITHLNRILLPSLWDNYIFPHYRIIIHCVTHPFVWSIRCTAVLRYPNGWAGTCWPTILYLLSKIFFLAWGMKTYFCTTISYAVRPTLSSGRSDAQLFCDIRMAGAGTCRPLFSHFPPWPLPCVTTASGISQLQDHFRSSDCDHLCDLPNSSAPVTKCLYVPYYLVFSTASL